jgi:hypothetical protein
MWGAVDDSIGVAPVQSVMRIRSISTIMRGTWLSIDGDI